MKLYPELCSQCPNACSGLSGPWQMKDLVTGEERVALLEFGCHPLRGIVRFARLAT